MSRKYMGAGVGVGVGVFITIGILINTGQYVPNNTTISSVSAGSGLTASAGVLAVGAGSGLTSSADAIDVVCGSGLSCAADAVSLSTSCAAGERLEWSGTAWECRATNDYRGKHFEWSEEFIGTSVAASNTMVGNFFVLLLGGLFASVNNSNRIGVADFQTSTSATGTVRYQTSGTFDFGQYSTATFEFTGGVPTISSSSEEYGVVAGFFLNAALSTSNGCFFRYDRSNLGSGSANPSNLHKWECGCSSASTATVYLMDGSTVSDGSFTTVDAPVAAVTLPNTNIQTLKIVVDGSTTAHFYVGGVESCRITQHIPSGAGTLLAAGIMLIKSVGTTSRSLYVDRARLAIDLSSARSL